MTQHIEIENYKSIKHLKLDTARVNVFIGEPNSGKSNILEALAWLSPSTIENGYIKDIFRFDNTSQLFSDSNTNKEVLVKTDRHSFRLTLGKQENGSFENIFRARYLQDDKDAGEFDIRFDGSIVNPNKRIDHTFQYYTFSNNLEQQVHFSSYLKPPYGDNLANLLINNPDLRKLVSDILRRKDLRLQLNSVENTLGTATEIDDIIYAYPYKAASETLRRFIFYKLAIETNKSSSLIFDEPEANTFPVYTREIGEMIALNNANQFFITTHNPYLLRSIIAKTPVNDLRVFVTSLSHYQTNCKLLSESELSEVLDSDMSFFFNLPE